MRKAKEIMDRIYRQHPSVLQEEPIVTYVDSLGDDSVVLGARGWTKSEDYWAARWDITEKIKLAFDEEGIEIPYRQMDVHITGSVQDGE